MSSENVDIHRIFYSEMSGKNSKCPANDWQSAGQNVQQSSNEFHALWNAYHSTQCIYQVLNATVTGTICCQPVIFSWALALDILVGSQQYPKVVWIYVYFFVLFILYFSRRLSGGLVPAGGKIRPLSQSPSTGVNTRPAPMKASHQIASAEFLESNAARTREINSAKLSKPSRHSSGSPSRGNVGVNISPTRTMIESLTPTHVTIRTAQGTPPKSAKLVKVGSIPANALHPQNGEGEASDVSYTPSPPSSAKPTRPGSAARFRNMVLSARDSPS